MKEPVIKPGEIVGALSFVAIFGFFLWLITAIGGCEHGSLIPIDGEPVDVCANPEVVECCICDECEPEIIVETETIVETEIVTETVYLCKGYSWHCDKTGGHHDHNCRLVKRWDPCEGP